MKVRATPRKRPEENLVPLINIVFLILIFFLVASTIRPFTERDVRLAETEEASGSGAVPRMLVLTRDNRQMIGGEEVSKEALMAQAAQWAGSGDSSVTVVADAELGGPALVEAVSALTAAGINDIKLLTRRGR